MPVSDIANLDRAAVRSLLAGLANSVFGLAIISLALMIGLGNYVANATGYAAGWILSFFLQRHYVFASSIGDVRKQMARFIPAIAVAYSANLFVLTAAVQVLHFPAVLAQAMAMTTYTAVLFGVCRYFVFVENPALVIPSPSASHIMLLLLVLAACLIIPGMPITHDVVWQFWIARQLNHGVELYSQINEVNPPLWFWMAMPIDRLASWAGANPINLVQFTIIALSATTYLATERLLADWDRWRRLFFLFNAFALGLVLALGNFAQREQIAMIVALPYILLIAKRAEASKLSLRFSLAVGLLAACGFALKHYFALVPILLELWLFIVLRRNYRPIRPETTALGVIAIAYGLAVWKFAPGFITVQVPMILAAYGGYSQPFIALVNDREQLLWLACLFAFLAHGWLRRDQFGPRATALWIATCGFFFSYIAQDKGWVYHSMPVSYFLLLALIETLLRHVRKLQELARYPVAVFALLLAYAFPIHFGPYESRFASTTNHTLKRAPRGSVVYILSTDAQKSWPMVAEGGYIWPSRFMSLWMVPAIGAKIGDTAELDRLSDTVRRMTVEDLECNPPEIFLIDRATINNILRPLNFDLRAYFLENPDARKLMSNYRLVETTPYFWTYERRQNSMIPAPSGCRKIY